MAARGGFRRPPEVRHWLRQPLWWAIAILAIAGLSAFQAARDVARDRALVRDGYRVTGRVLPSWDGGSRVPVTYEDPEDGRSVTATASAADGDSLRAGERTMVVDREDPDRVRLAGPIDDVGWTARATLVVWLLLGIGFWGGLRRSRVIRTEAAIASRQVEERAWALARPGRICRRSWRLHLYSADAPPGARPLQSVRVIGSTAEPEPVAVEVLGHTRSSHLVVREQETGRIWWPARTIRGSRPRPVLPVEGQAPIVDRRSPLGAALLLAGLAVVVVGRLGVGDPEADLRARARPVSATVVLAHDGFGGSRPTQVDVRLAGKERQVRVRLAGPADTGERVDLLADPERPGVLWQPGSSRPPVDSPVDAGLLTAIGALVAVVGLAALRRPVSSRQRRAPAPVDEWPGMAAESPVSAAGFLPGRHVRTVEPAPIVGDDWERSPGPMASPPAEEFVIAAPEWTSDDDLAGASEDGPGPPGADPEVEPS